MKFMSHCQLQEGMGVLYIPTRFVTTNSHWYWKNSGAVDIYVTLSIAERDVRRIVHPHRDHRYQPRLARSGDDHRIVSPDFKYNRRFFVSIELNLHHRSTLPDQANDDDAVVRLKILDGIDQHRNFDTVRREVDLPGV